MPFCSRPRFSNSRANPPSARGIGGTLRWDTYLTIEKLRADEPEWVDLRAKMRRRPLRGEAFKIVLALDDFPHYAAAGSEGEARALAAAQFRIAPTLDYLDDSYSDMLRGRVPERPIIWGLCHSLPFATTAA